MGNNYFLFKNFLFYIRNKVKDDFCFCFGVGKFVEFQLIDFRNFQKDVGKEVKLFFICLSIIYQIKVFFRESVFVFFGVVQFVNFQGEKNLWFSGIEKGFGK